MAKRKKTRKVGQIGVRSVPKDQRAPATASGKPKKRKGNTAGSRHSAAKNVLVAQTSANRDPRAGSKKPIPLVVEQAPKTVAKKKYFSPKQELAAIEEDNRLSKLLDKVDQGKRLSQEDQAYVDERLARHRVLCDLLGIKDEEEEEFLNEDDPLAAYDAINVDDYK